MKEDQETAHAVRMLLRESAVPPGRADIGQAVRLGRQAERRRRGAAAAAVAVSAVLGVIGATTGVLGRVEVGRPEAAGSSPAVTFRPVTTITPEVEIVPVTVPERDAQCAITRLILPAGHRGAPILAADHSGRFVVGSSVGAAGSGELRNRVDEYLLWDRGVPSSFQPPGAGTPASQVVNASGVVAGTETDSTDNGWIRGFGWTYQNGQARRLPLLPGYDAVQVGGINDRGDIVGHAYRMPVLGDSDSSVGVPVIWPAGGSGTPRVVSGPDHGGMVVGVTEDGTVVGREDLQTRIWRPDGTRADLRVPDGWDRAVGTGVSGDWVAGFVGRGREQGPTPPMRWNVRTGKMYIYTGLDTESHFSTYVSSTGRMIVGTPRHGMLVVEPDGTVGRLPIPPGVEKTSMTAASAITDNGMVIGWSWSQSGPEAFTWQCGG